MNPENKVLLYSIIISVVLASVVFYVADKNLKISKQEFDAKLSSGLLEQKEDYDNQIDALNELLNDDMGVLQNLITNVDKENKKRSKDLLDLIEKVESESKEAVEKAREELESEIEAIETLSTDFSKIAQESLGSVVSVLTDKGQGSGAIISRDGEVITNYHVIQGAGAVNVLSYDKTIYRADVVGFDADVDIAVLKIKSNETFRRLMFGDSDDVNIGETVVALGNPLGLDFTVTQGIISARRLASNDVEYIQIDVPLNPGNSGGPLIDAAGKIIGINTFGITGGEGLGFAIPSNTAEDAYFDVS